MLALRIIKQTIRINKPLLKRPLLYTLTSGTSSTIFRLSISCASVLAGTLASLNIYFLGHDFSPVLIIKKSILWDSLDDYYIIIIY